MYTLLMSLVCVATCATLESDEQTTESVCVILLCQVFGRSIKCYVA